MNQLSQEQMFYQADRRLADGNEIFMELVKDGMTREELEKLIARRPEKYSRFSGFLKTLPSGG